MNRTASQWASDAILVQDACNSSGIVHTFSTLMSDLSDYSFQKNKGTSWKNRHPLVILFVDKLASLCGSNLNYGHDSYGFHRAYEWAKTADSFEYE